MELCTPTGEAGLRSWAAGHHGACDSPGEPGYCLPEQANWSVETLSADLFAHVWECPEAAMAWISDEIKMAEEEGIQRDWHLLLVEPIREEIYCLLRDGQAHTWDGYHRAAALIATGRPIVAIVGRPMESQQHISRPTRMRM
jgi:hypothetical protein